MTANYINLLENLNISSEIFKAYDIRGIVGRTLTSEVVEAIGIAFGSEIKNQGGESVCVGFDGRLSSPELSTFLIRGIRATGVHVFDIGRVTTPMLYFATFTRQAGSGIMITGSHNPPEYNGLKMMIQETTLSGESIQDLLRRIQQRKISISQTLGSYQKIDIEADYYQAIQNVIQLKRPMKVIIDAGNGIAGQYAPILLKKLGCEVTELFCEVDGTFPNHHPDPAQPKNLKDLIDAIEFSDADIGLAFDGDGDRLGVVTHEGKIIYPDRQLMLFARDMLSRNPNAKVIYDVKSSRYLAHEISKYNGQPIICRTGHSFIKAKMKETQALLAGEMSGHLFFKENWFGVDDGVYAGVKLLEILSQYTNGEEIANVFNQLPEGVNTPELQIHIQSGKHHEFIATLQQNANFPTAQDIITIDGLRVEYTDGFGLIRGSNTTPTLVLRFEAESQESLERIRNEFQTLMYQFDKNLTIPK